jgi:NADH:ubiquinone oxidoreductase subunit 3 (subunit A)
MDNGIKILLSPPLAFLIFLCVSFIIYKSVGSLATKGKPSPGKLKTYTGGEDIPGAKIQFGYKSFFFIAVSFTMIEISTLVIATIQRGFSILGIFYLAMIFISILSLITWNTF